MAPQPLRVAFDATPLLGVRTGVGAFCLGALGALGERGDVEVGAFAVSWRRRQGIRDHLPPGVAVIDTPMPARPLHAAWERSRVPPVEWFIGRHDVVHGSNFVVPPTRRAARVATVHDLTAIRFPEMCDAYTRHYPVLVRRAVAEGAWVHTPSRFVADEVVELLGVPAERVRAVHHGVPALDPPDAEPAAAQQAGRGAPYLLALGTVEPRKDLPTLVQAFDGVAATIPDLRLVVAGPDGWGTEAFATALSAAAHRDRVDRVGYVDGARRAALLRGASLYAYPSIYEGFGLPTLEAMTAGVPVVTTTAGALPEVVGAAAVCVAPGDVEALAAAITSVLTDDAQRAELVERGRRRVARFSWAATGQGLADLYRDAVAGGPRPCK
jgi:glycosyltransferase involved in cell wall biosynthesis